MDSLNENKHRSKSKIKEGMSLHKHIAAGGDPADYKCSKGIDSSTIPGIETESED